MWATFSQIVARVDVKRCKIVFWDLGGQVGTHISARAQQRDRERAREATENLSVCKTDYACRKDSVYFGASTTKKAKD